MADIYANPKAQVGLSYLFNTQRGINDALAAQIEAQQQAQAARQAQLDKEYKDHLAMLAAQQEQQMAQVNSLMSADFGGQGGSGGNGGGQAGSQNTGSAVVDFLLSGDTDFKDKTGRNISADNASYFNRKVLDEAVDKLAAEKGWNETRKAVEKDKAKKFLEGKGGIKFDVEDRGITGAIGDTANIFVDSVVGSTLELGAAVYAWGETKLSDDHSSGKAFVDWVSKIRKDWTSLQSEEAKDTAKAREQARGVTEMLDVMVDNPSGALDVLTYGLGQVFGAKGAGAGVKAAGMALGKRGVKQAASARLGANVLLAEGKSLAGLNSVNTLADTLRTTKPLLSKSATVMDDITRAAGKQMLDSNAFMFGTRSAYRLGMGNAKAAAGRGLIAAGDRIGRIDPLKFAALSEAAGTHNDILRQDGAYNADTKQFTEDARNTALTAGLLTGGITYGMGKLGNTFEGSVSRALSRGAAPTSRAISRAEASSVSRLLLADGETTVSSALRAVGDDLARNAQHETTKQALGKVTEFLSSPQALSQMAKYLDGNKSALGVALSGAGTLKNSMLAEGVEEGLIGLVSSVASQGLDKDGNFSMSNVDWKQAFEAASGAATLGAMMGVVGAGVELQQQHAETRAAAQQIIDAATDPNATLGVGGQIARLQQQQVNNERTQQIEAEQARIADALAQSDATQLAEADALAQSDVLAQQQAAAQAEYEATMEAATRAQMRPEQTDAGILIQRADAGEVVLKPAQRNRLENYAQYASITNLMNSGAVDATDPTVLDVQQQLFQNLGGDAGVRSAVRLINTLNRNLAAAKQADLFAAPTTSQAQTIQLPVRKKTAFSARNVGRTLGIPAGDLLKSIKTAFSDAERKAIVTIVDAIDAGADLDTTLDGQNSPELQAAAQELGISVEEMVNQYKPVADSVIEERNSTPDPEPDTKATSKETKEKKAEATKKTTERQVKKSKAAGATAKKKEVAARVKEAVEAQPALFGVPEEQVEDTPEIEFESRTLRVNLEPAADGRWQVRIQDLYKDEDSGESSWEQRSANQYATYDEAKAAMRLMRTELSKANPRAAEATGLFKRETKKTDSQIAAEQAAFDAQVEATLNDVFSEELLLHRGEGTVAEQDLAVLRATRDKYESWISSVYGDADGVVFVAPSHPRVPKGVNGFVHKADPTRIYVVLDTAKSMEDVLWTVAHERLHQGINLNYGRTSLLTADDFRSQLDAVAQNDTVRALMDAMAAKYGGKDHHTRVEEALAELAAARATNDYDRIKREWGVDVPAGLRADRKSNVVADFFRTIKRVIRGLLGKSDAAYVSDAQVATFLRNANKFDRNALADATTGVPAEAAALAAELDFDNTEYRTAQLHRDARAADPAFDTRSEEEQSQLLYSVAADTGNDVGGSQTAGSFDPALNQYAAKKTQQYLQQKAAQIQQQVIDEQNEAAKTAKQNGGIASTFRTMVASAVIYPRRPDGADYDVVNDQHVGVIAFVDGRGDVKIKLRQGDQLVEHVIEHRQDRPYEETWAEAVQFLHTTYPDMYNVKDGVALQDSLFLSTPQNQSPALAVHDMAVMGRVQERLVENPILQRVADHLKKFFPDRWHHMMDSIVDYLSGLYVHWVDKNDAFKQVVRKYQAATGDTKDVVNLYLADQALADANIHRTTDEYGNLKSTTGSYKDAASYVIDLISNSKLGAKKMEGILYAFQEYLAYPELLGRYGQLDKNNNLVLIDPHNGKQQMNATGFSFDSFSALGDRTGGLDFGAARFMQEFAQLSREERAEAAEIIAAVAHTNRTVARIQKDNGTIDARTYRERTERGRTEIDALFPELAGQFDFGGFYMTMKDNDSNAYSTADRRGRHTMAKDIIDTWQRTMVANVRKAFANKHWTDFIRIVAVTPNSHFRVDPARAVYNEDGALTWEWDNKDAKYTKSAIVHGVPVRLVATSKAGEAMLRNKQPGELVQTVGKVNGILAPLKTAYNLGYVLVGLVRDIITGYANIQGAIGSDLVSDNDAHKVGLAAIANALRSIPNTLAATYKDTGRSDWLQNMEEIGGGIFFGDRINTGTYRTDVLRVRSLNPLLKKAGNAVKAFGYAPEAAMRVGAFQAYMQHVFPELRGNPTADQIRKVLKDPANREKVAKIIQATKNVTTNFQQHGADNLVRHVLSFQNATVQGTFATLPQTLATRHGRKVYGMLLTAAALTAAAGIAGSDEDEFGNSKYFQATGRERKLIIGDWAIPLNDELMVGKVFIDNLIGILSGKRNVVDATVDITNATFDSVTSGEMGKSGNLAADMLYGVTPTFAQGLVSVATGYDIFGNPLKKDALYDSNGRRISNPANFELSTGMASSAGNELAQFLYGLTGGMVNTSGNQVDVLGQSILGGVYGTLKRAWGSAESDGAAGVVESVAGDFTRGFKTRYISKEGREAWKDLHERAAVSSRHAGTSLDVLKVGTEQEGKRLVAELKRWDKKIWATRSPSGFKPEQLREMIAEAERNGDSATVRDLRAEQQAMYDEQEVVRREAFDAMRMKGYM